VLAFERSSAASGPILTAADFRDLIKACLQKERPIPVVSAFSSSHQPAENPAKESLDNHRSIDLYQRVGSVLVVC
jgi:hypothetical protein